MFPFPFSFIVGVPDIPVDRIANAQAMSFNGTDQYINAGNYNNVQFQATDAFSISAWININGTTSGADFIVSNGLWNTSPYSGWGLEINGANTIRFDLTDDNVNQLTIDSSGLTLNTNTWYHVVFTYDGSSSATGMNFYLDGSLTSKTIFRNQTLSTITYTSINLNIGARENGVKPWNGKLDEVAIFNTALSADKIQQIYDATAVVGGVPQTANLFTGGLSSSLVYWNRMGDS
jgi:hypothetical protein